MLEINDISFRYSRRSAPVLEHFSLNVAPGSICGLLGKNGTGKSTLLYLVSGLLHPQQGQVRIDGMVPQERRPELLSEIFLVPEEFELPSISLDQYVRLNRPFYPRFSDEVLRQCLADFELSGELKLGSLSMGQKKKVFMSFALATGTRLLLMDEPTNGLDIPSKSQFRRVVSSRMADDRIILISTHQVRDVEMLIDRVAMIGDSGLLVDASVADICRRLRFEQRAPGEDVSDALYVEPSIAGNSVIAPGESGFEETPINLELLFNAVLEKPNLLTPEH